MSIVLTYGTFDLFHIGHVNLLRRLRELGSRLIVGCSTDEFNTIKGKSVITPYEHRRQILLSCRYVDGVFPESSWDQKRSDIIREKADIFAMGDDWAGKFDELSDLTKVIYLPRTKDVSTTEIKQLVNAAFSEKKAEFRLYLNQLAKLAEEM
jgi:glycerol-3-phosphate cytidylyltransferase